MEKLTKAQEAMLCAPRRDGSGCVVRHSLANAGSLNRTAQALERKGLIEWKPGRHFGGMWVITDLGRSALSKTGPGR